MTKLNEIRAEFLDFFEKNNHAVLSSSPVIPENDPTLMFVNAGMVPFKDYFIGNQIPKTKRAGRLRLRILRRARGRKKRWLASGICRGAAALTLLRGDLALDLGRHGENIAGRSVATRAAGRRWLVTLGLRDQVRRREAQRDVHKEFEERGGGEGGGRVDAVGDVGGVGGFQGRFSLRDLSLIHI